MFTESATETLNKASHDYGSINTAAKPKHNKSNACKFQLTFVLLLIFTSLLCITLSVYPAHKSTESTSQKSFLRRHQIDTTLCSTHICLYDMNAVTDISSQNELEMIRLLLEHPSTLTDTSKYAFVNKRKFVSSPQTLTITHSAGNIVSIPLKAHKNNGLHYFEDAFENRFVLFIHSIEGYNAIEGYGACNGQKLELHSFGNDEWYLLLDKEWIQDTTNWCGIFDINTKYTAIANDLLSTEDTNDILSETLIVWLSTAELITNHIGLEGLFVNKGFVNEYTFVTEPLCTDMSVFDGLLYCLYPNSDTWNGFEYLRFFTYSLLEGQWTELSDDNRLDLGASNVNIPKAMSVMADNEIYVFSVNGETSMVSVYSFTDSWRMHHYTPEIIGDLDLIEIDSVFVNNVLYFSVNEYSPLGNCTVYQYIIADLIFSEFESFEKTDLPIYSHCLTEFEDSLLIYFVDYGHNLWAFYEGESVNLEFNIAAQIETNQFKCVWTAEKGNFVSWKYGQSVYYLQFSLDSFAQISEYSSLPWTVDSDVKGNLFQLIAMRNSINSYKSVSVYYTNDILDNYLTDLSLMEMDIQSIVSLSNIVYSIHNNYKHLMRLEGRIYEYASEDINEFTSYGGQDGQSDINVLLVDVMSESDEIGYSQCSADDTDQSFAVVQYTAF